MNCSIQKKQFNCAEYIRLTKNIYDISPALALKNKKVCFLYSKDGGIIEFVENS